MKEELDQLNEDIEFYKNLMQDYEDLDSSDYTTAYNLAIVALLTADRWNEILLESAKYSKELDITKSRFENYCYQKYKILLKMHDFCRMVHRKGAYGINNSFYGEDLM